MLDWPLLASLWTFAAFNFVMMFVWMAKRFWTFSAISYLLVGLFGIAFPFKIGLQATSILGMIFLSVIWPAWLAQDLIGFKLLEIGDPSMWALMFNFGQ
jgi:hypothetical protein